MENVERYLGNVIDYSYDNRDYYNQSLTIWYIEKPLLSLGPVLFEENVNNLTITDPNEIFDIYQRINKEMLQVEDAVGKDGNNIISYKTQNDKTFFYPCEYSEIQLYRLKAIKAKQEMIRERERAIDTEKQKKQKKFGALFLAGCLTLTLIGGIGVSNHFIQREIEKSKIEMQSIIDQLIEEAEKSELALTDTLIEEPTQVPTAIPTQVPTAIPTQVPTAIPTQVPTAIPTQVPTAIPTQVPTAIKHPTAIPTSLPVERPMIVVTPKPIVIIEENIELVKQLQDALVTGFALEKKKEGYAAPSQLLESTAVTAAIQILNTEFTVDQNDEDKSRRDFADGTSVLERAIYLGSKYNLPELSLSKYVKNTTNSNELKRVEVMSSTFTKNKDNEKDIKVEIEKLETDLHSNFRTYPEEIDFIKSKNLLQLPFKFKKQQQEYDDIIYNVHETLLHKIDDLCFEDKSIRIR